MFSNAAIAWGSRLNTRNQLGGIIRLCKSSGNQRLQPQYLHSIAKPTAREQIR